MAPDPVSRASTAKTVLLGSLAHIGELSMTRDRQYSGTRQYLGLTLGTHKFSECRLPGVFRMCT